MQLVDFWVLYFKDTYQIYFHPQNPQVRVHYKKKNQSYSNQFLSPAPSQANLQVYLHLSQTENL